MAGSAGVAKRIEEGVGSAATALTAKAHLVQASDATAQAARVTGVAEAAKGKGLAGKAVKAAASKAAGSAAGRKVAAAAASRTPAAMPGLLSKVASAPGLGTAGKVVGGLARFAPWVAGANAAIGAVRGGYDAYEKGGSALDVAKGAAWGAADQVTVGLASWAYGKGAQIAKGVGNAVVPPAQAQEAVVGKKSGWSPGQIASENRATSAEVDSTGVGAVDVAKGGYHPKALEFYGPADKALYASRKARGVQDMPMPGAGSQTPGLVRQPANTPSPGVQRDAWDTMLRGNPDLAAQLKREGGDKFKPWDAGEQQRRMDAIHIGSGGRSDGRGQVNWGLPSNGGADTQRGSSLAPDQSRAFNAASQHYADSHMTGETAQKQPPTYGPSGDGRRGFAIPKVQAAAQAAKGNQYDGPEE